MEIHNYESFNSELMSCPFCGKTPVWYLKGNADMIGKKRTVVVFCPTCGATQETSVLQSSTQWACSLAITKWNRRIEKDEH